MAYSQEQLAWIRLANVHKLGTQRFNALLERFGTAQAVWDALDKDNRVSLYVCVDGNEVIINKHGGEDETK